MGIQEHLDAKASEYKEALIRDLESATTTTSIINSLFFPDNQMTIQTWLKESEMGSFGVCKYTGTLHQQRFCTREELERLTLPTEMEFSFDMYSIFSSLETDSWDLASEKASSFYHFVRDDYYKVLDRLIFERLQGYRQAGKYLYEKKLSARTSLVLSTKREHMWGKGIIGYTFPFLSLKSEHKERIDLFPIDIRSLLSLQADSFFFFYTDCHTYTVGPQTMQVSDLKRKPDEPVIYKLENKNSFLVTNSPGSIASYNKYMRVILAMSMQYYRFLENWLVENIPECR